MALLISTATCLFRQATAACAAPPPLQRAAIFLSGKAGEASGNLIPHGRYRRVAASFDATGSGCRSRPSARYVRPWGRQQLPTVSSGCCSGSAASSQRGRSKSSWQRRLYRLHFRSHPTPVAAGRGRRKVGLVPFQLDSRIGASEWPPATVPLREGWNGTRSAGSDRRDDRPCRGRGAGRSPGKGPAPP